MKSKFILHNAQTKQAHIMLYTSMPFKQVNQFCSFHFLTVLHPTMPSDSAFHKLTALTEKIHLNIQLYKKNFAVSTSFP